LYTAELGGKRGARIARARAAALAARAVAVGEAQSRVDSVYTAAREVRRRELLAQALGEEDSAMTRVLALVRARYEQGSTGRVELARVEGEVRAAALAREAAEREARLARSSLAAVVGLPPGALPPDAMSVSTSQGCRLAGEPRDSLLRSALGESWALRRAVAAYQVAEGDVRVEVANAAPDLSLRPTLSFDQGSGKFGIGFGLPSLPRQRNRGPIAEAEARRSIAGAEVDEVQEAVLAAVDGALATCGAADMAVAAADSLAAAADSGAGFARQAFERGETGRLEVALADLEVAREGRGRAEALARWESAGSALEVALGAWGRLSDGPWPALPGVDPPGER
jgi:outer membrane protein TolC